MPNYDFHCEACALTVEEIVSVDTKSIACPQCKQSMARLPAAPHTLTEIVPSYPGSLKQKAGYTHSHGDKPATKVQSGYGGCGNPK